MFNGADAGLDGFFDPQRAVAMCGNIGPKAFRCCHNSAKLFGCGYNLTRYAAKIQHRPCAHIFDKIDPCGTLLTAGLQHGVCTVNFLIERSKAGVAPCSGCQNFARGDNTCAGQNAAVDVVAYGYRGIIVIASITDGGVTQFQISLGVSGAVHYICALTAVH